VSHDPTEQPHMELSMLTLDMLDMELTQYNSDNFLVFHHSIFDIILINFLCHMTLLSNPMELYILTFDMLDMDLTLYNFDNHLELYYIISDCSLINKMRHMTLLSNPISVPMTNFNLNILVSLKYVVCKEEEQQEEQDAENVFLDSFFLRIKIRLIGLSSLDLWIAQSSSIFAV
jgi:hypothetical protein